MKKLYQYLKRFMDLLLALVLFLPALALVSLCYVLIKLETKGPAFFVQERPGYKGRLFKIYKLRTMIEEKKRIGKPLGDMDRLTHIGKIIRSLSLDELPQLLNILKGEMSFIGPRPLLPEYIPLYSPDQMRRHDVLPGISGWAQVNGRNEISWEQRFERDIWYVENISLKLDLKILWMTIINILKHKGINAEVGETMCMFNGNSVAEDSAPQEAEII